MQPGQSQSSDGAETIREDKNQKVLCVHWWKKWQRQCESIALWVEGASDKLQGNRCNMRLELHMWDFSSGFSSFWAFYCSLPVPTGKRAGDPFTQVRCTGPSHHIRGHPRLLKELADVTEELTSIPFDKFWQRGKIPNAWKKAGVAPTSKKGKKDPGYL